MKQKKQSRSSIAETYTVEMWLNNDQDLYNEAVRTCRNATRDCKTREDAILEAADALERMVEDDMDLPANLIGRALLSDALLEVDWEEIADGFVKESGWDK